MMKKQRIMAFHLLNDRSGSPKVLSQLIAHWALNDKYDVHLFTHHSEDGFLAHIHGIYYHKAWYRYMANPWLRLLYYSLSQMVLFFKLLVVLHKTDIVYVNTILPFGAALAGKIRGCKVIYHIHESSIQPVILRWFLLQVVKTTAREIIYVSQYVQDALSIHGVRSCVIYNAIDENFVEQVKKVESKNHHSHVLMVCSLKKYKGLQEFVQMAADNAGCQFKLVLNGSEKDVYTFFSQWSVPENLKLYATQRDLHPFYQWADVIVNLSRPDEWIETFGLTIVEGMAYGLPAIVPPVGGILEVIEAGVTGYAVDCRNREALNARLKMMLNSKDQYQEMQKKIFHRLQRFREPQMLHDVDQVLDSQLGMIYTHDSKKVQNSKI